MLGRLSIIALMSWTNRNREGKIEACDLRKSILNATSLISLNSAGFIYNEEKRIATFPTGGAITINSDPEAEYEECMLKAEAMRNALMNHVG